jgi:hypothetical protein
VSSWLYNLMVRADETSMRVRNLPNLSDRTSRQFVCACAAGGPSGGVAVTTKALLIAPSTMLTERLIGSPSSAPGARIPSPTTI